MNDIVAELHRRVEAQRDHIIAFLCQICAIPSVDGQIGPVGERIAQEMRALGYDAVR